jgi:TonB family protein
VPETLGREGRKNVSATTNTIPKAGETSSERSSAPARPNPIAAEIPVNASGSRPKNGGTERELFSEDTTTVLTFEDGAVVRLLATVTPGQLIFLTNLVTKQEVVCEVLRKRLLRPAGCYVELQFTERKKAFWDAPQGVAAQTAAEPAAGKAKKAAQPVESGAKTKPREPETHDPSKKSIEALVSEVQILLAKKGAPEEKEPAAEADARGAASAGAKRPAAETTPVNPEEGKTTPAESDDASDDLLPKPELDFSNVPNAPAAKKHDATLLHKPIPVVGATTHKLTWALLLLTFLGVGARYGHWLDFLTRANVAAVNPVGRADSTVSAALAGPKDGAAKAGETEKSQAVTENVRLENPRAENGEPTARVNEPAHLPAEEKSAVKADADRSGKSLTSTTVQAELPPEDADAAGQEPLAPAKLLKSVNPLYPPDAMRSFITGDVKAEVDVDSTGHAADVKVLSGPTQLRKAAVDAVKQYEFSPATRGGKAVASKVIVTVKFWFNP